MIDQRYSISKKFLKESEVEDSILTITEKESARVEDPFNQKFLQFFWVFIILVLGIIGVRVFYLTIVKGDHYGKIAKGNSIRSIPIKAPRGKIYDKHGKVLVENVPSLDAVVTPVDLPDNDDGKREVAERLASILKINKDDVLNVFEKLNLNSANPVLIKEKITQEESLIILEKSKDLQGIGIEKAAVRNYRDSLIFSHVLGYEGKIVKKELEENPDYLLTDYIGKQGIEKHYEQYLRGDHGAKKIEVDSMGRAKKEIGITNPKPGSELFLNIDADLQKKIFDVLKDSVEKNEIKAAAAVALDPRDGGVVAMVSVPSYDNNLFASGISSEEYSKLIRDSDKPMFNRAVSGEYPPASTIKPLIGAAALEEGIITESTSVESKGGIAVGEYYFGDWKTHGYTNVKEAIAVSSDVFFYSVGGGFGGIQGLGMEKMKYYDNLFGMGEKTGIDLPGEASGFIPSKEWKLETIGERWYVGNSYHASIGQGYITATPLQVANFTAAIANEGTLYSPRIVSHIKKNTGEVISNSPKVIREIPIAEKNIEIAKEGMRLTVTEGTAVTLNDLETKIAGKTGTAQYGTEDKTHGWFSSFAPYENPEIVLVILIEGQEENDTYHAVPATKEVYKWYFKESESD